MLSSRCGNDLPSGRSGRPLTAVVQRVPVEAEAEDIDGVTVHVLLHVIDGYIDELEIYRDDSAPLRGTIRPEALSIIVL